MRRREAAAWGVMAIAIGLWAGLREASAVSRQAPCSGARLDGEVRAAGVGHNSFASVFRAPFGAVRTDQGSVTLRLRACHSDLDRARVRLWNSVEGRETWVSMQLSRGGESSRPEDAPLGPVDYWEAEIPVPAKPTLLYYFFELGDRETRRYYTADPAGTFTGGWGRFRPEWDDQNSFQLTVYDRNFQVPGWLQGATLYQILPDRFRNGDRNNDPAPGSGFVFGKPIRFLPWNQDLCDPRSASCPGESDNQFYGGDLEGVRQKLDVIRELGVKAIYFNPIFLSATNHRYDTQDYFQVDPKLGTLAEFDRLVEQARARGMKVILDGVFNHGSADSPYFDLFKRWPGVGACESPESPFRGWFYFPHFLNEPQDYARPGTYHFCAGLNGTLTTYESWWGYYEHPVYRKDSDVIRKLFFTDGARSVAPYWVQRGIGGWRLDVAGDVDPGEGNGSRLGFWPGFRQAIKAMNPEAIMIGEEWANASPWLLGREWDSATNYRWRAALLSWLADGCTGLGCDGDVFEDDDNHRGSSGGALAPISEREFDRRLRSIQENYPPEAWHAMMNPLGSHDTQRVLFVLKKISKDDAEMARRKLKLAAIFQFTYPGAPVILYGDEVGVAAEGRWYDGKWKDDPYTRAVYPWEDLGRRPDLALRDHFRLLGQLRDRLPALSKGSYETVLADDQHRVFAFRRAHDAQQVWVVLNRAPSAASIELAIPADSLPEGTVLSDVLNGGELRVSQGKIALGEVPALWGRILVAEPARVR